MMVRVRRWNAVWSMFGTRAAKPRAQTEITGERAADRLVRGVSCGRVMERAWTSYA